MMMECVEIRHHDANLAEYDGCNRTGPSVEMPNEVDSPWIWANHNGFQSIAGAVDSAGNRPALPIGVAHAFI